MDGHLALLALQVHLQVWPWSRAGTAPVLLLPMYGVVVLPCLAPLPPRLHTPAYRLFCGPFLFFKYDSKFVYIYKRGPTHFDNDDDTMDGERLTPYLRRRCLALRVMDRVALEAIIRESLTPSQRTEDKAVLRLECLAEAMCAINGIEVRQRTRKMEYVKARTIFAFVARQEGFSQTTIGDFLGINHSTIHYLEAKMGDAFKVPESWRDYIELYNQFTSAIL